MANTFNNNLTTSVGTTLTEVYSTNSLTKATVIGINISNNTENTIVADIVLENETAVQGSIVTRARIPAGTSLAAMGGDQKLVMVENNKLYVKTNVDNSSDVVVSVLEMTQ